MSCEMASSTVHAYADGELDAMQAADFERHLQTCRDCRAAQQRIESLRASFREAALREHASPEFRARIRRQLGLTGAPAHRSVMIPPRWLWFGGFATAAAAMIAIVFLIVQPRMENARMGAGIIDAQVRSLQTGHLTDIESSDSSKVQPWFAGKLDFVPPVQDYSGQGFRLIGARVDTINDRKAAVLVYARGRQFINLFVWRYDSDDKGAAGSGSARGFHWLMWQPRDLRFCLVSNGSPEDLQELKRLLRG